MDIKIILENKDFIALDKPAGLLVHGIFDKHGSKHSELTVVDWVLANYPELKDVGDAPVHNSSSGSVPWRPGIVHRLDRETSGVLLVARNQESFRYLKELFQNKKIEKKYIGLVWGKTDKKGLIDKAISIKDGTVKRTVFKGKMSRPAQTEYLRKTVYEYSNELFSLLDIWPKTGRTHQIRVHLSSIGHNIVGDKLYGKKAGLLNLDRQFLHAQEIHFLDQEGKEQLIQSELAPELKQILNSLKILEDDQAQE